MAEFNLAHEKSCQEIAHVAVTIERLNSDQRHMGVLYRRTDSVGDEFGDAAGVFVLHLTFPRTLKHEAAGNGRHWIEPDINPRRQRFVADVCRMVLRANVAKGVPFGFSVPSEKFDAVTGEFRSSSDGDGLTCASFVLAVFDRAGLPLARYETWPVDREDDVRWQGEATDHLVAHGESGMRIPAIRAEIEAGARRFRPEEVAGAAVAYAPSRPVDFAVAEQHAGEIVRALNRAAI